MQLWVDGDFSLWSKSFDYDDCIALIQAVSSCNVKGVSCVGGNVNVKAAVQNALKAVSLIKKIPVYEGVNPPSNKWVGFLSFFRRLLDNRKFKLPEPKSSGDAVKALSDQSSMVDKAVFLGPLTNLALSKAEFKELIIMAGAIGIPGNITPFAEFNAFLDPESLSQVLEHEVTVIPLNTTLKATVTWPFLNDFKGELSHINKLPFLTLHDPLVMTYALKPELFKTKRVGLRVRTKGLRRGQTYIAQGSNVTLVTDFDRKGFIKFFKNCLKDYLE